MKYFSWNPEKNEALKAERGVSFDEMALLIDQGMVLDVIEHPNQARYPGQRIFVVRRDNYAYLVPFIEDSDGIFLKTIIPSRIATREYLGRSN